MVIVSIHEKRAALQAVINATAAYALNVVAGFAGIDRTAFAARVSPRPPVVVGEIVFAAAMRFAADSLLEESGFEPWVPLSGRCVRKTVPTDPRLLPRERKPAERDRGFESRSLQR
jgi:hypothetical protein